MPITTLETPGHLLIPRSEPASGRARAEELVLWSARRLAHEHRSSTPPTPHTTVFSDVRLAHRAWGVQVTLDLLCRLIMLLIAVPAPRWCFLHPSFADRSTDECTYLNLICALQRAEYRTAERLLRDRRCAGAAAPISRLACCYACELAISDVCLPTHSHLPAPG